MNIVRKIEVAEAEVKQAVMMVEHSQKQVEEWQERAEIRRENLRNLQAQLRAEKPEVS